jgi:hypothetical protein
MGAGVAARSGAKPRCHALTRVCLKRANSRHSQAERCCAAVRSNLRFRSAARPEVRRRESRWAMFYRRNRNKNCAFSAVLLAALQIFPALAAERLDRTVLPIREPKAPLYTQLDARDAKPPPRFEVKVPEGAPNVLIILIDDMGFGQSSAFGGPIHMPTV